VGAIGEALETLAALPAWVIYLVLGVGSAIENLFPPVPSDAFVVAGGILAARGAAHPTGVFLATWLPNAASAVGIYWMAWTYGGRFFQMPLAHWLLRPHQLEQVARFHRRWGVPAIFAGRLLPGWRVMVPVFAGVTRMPAGRVVAALVVASALWYGILIQLGGVAGRNLPHLTRILAEGGRVLVWVGVALLIVAAAWWWRTRHPDARP
jgi:membrane protein DedA with SNARE-associated domain